MGANMGPYGPLVALNRMAAQTQGLNLANQLTQNQLGGQAALGQYFQAGGGAPGGFPGYNPATPEPGQSSQPAQFPQITPQGVAGPPGGTPMPSDPSQPLPQISVPPSPSSPAGGMQAASTGGMPAATPVSLTGADATQALAASGQPGGQQPGAPAQPSSGTGAPGQQGVVTLDKVLSGIVKANPKATPTQVYNAAALYLPFMNAEDNALLRQALYQTRAYGIDVRAQTAENQIQSKEAIAAGVQAGATERAKMHIAAGDARSQAAISERYAQLAQQAAQFAARQDYLRVNAIQNEMQREAQTAATAAMTAQDQEGAAKIMQQAQADSDALRQQLQAGSAGGKAPNVRTLRVVPGASPPLGATGGFQ